MSNWKKIEGGVCAAQGFRAGGIHVGVKSHNTDKKDIALIATYDEDQIGSRMSTNYVCVTSTMTIKSAMRTTVKKFEAGIANGSADAALLSATAANIDHAAAKGVIHKNAANRKKSRLAKRLNQAKAEG